MKMHSLLLLILLIGLPVTSCAMENCDLSDAIGSEGVSMHGDPDDEDAKLFAGLTQPNPYESRAKTTVKEQPASDKEEQVVIGLDDLPEAEVDEHGDVVQQLRHHLSFEEQDELNKHVGPDKFRETRGIVDYKLHGPQKPAEQPVPKDSDPKKDASKESK